MPRMTDRQRMAFIRLIRESLFSLANLPRTGWGTRGVPISVQETVLEHSFGVASLAYFLAWYEKILGANINPEHALALGFFHDHPEAETGDIPRPFYEILEQLGVLRESIERKAQERQGKDLHPLLKKALDDLFEEFLKGETPEARVAREADNLQAGMKALDYLNRGHNTVDIVEKTRRQLQEGSAKEVWDWTFSQGRDSSELPPPQKP